MFSAFNLKIYSFGLIVESEMKNGNIILVMKLSFGTALLTKLQSFLFNLIAMILHQIKEQNNVVK